MRITKRRWLSSAAALMLLSLCAVPAWCSGPAPYALIFCTAWGPQERPVYGVHVRLRRAGEKKFRWEATSDHRGEFAFRVPAGNADYVLVPDVRQDKAHPAPETKIHIEGDERVDLSIHLATQ